MKLLWIVSSLLPLSIAAAPHYGDVKAKVFNLRCIKCHAEPGAAAGLDLFSYDALKASGVVVPGKADDSTLMQRVVAGEMPEDGPPLNPDELKWIREWIDGGAVDVPPAATLSLKAVRPAFGSRAGGTLLELDGDFLSTAKTVLVGGQPCLMVNVVSDQRITCQTPSRPSTGKVSVRVEAGSSVAELADAFEYRLELGGTYQSLAMNVFGPRCVKCHSGPRAPKGLDLSSHSTMLGHRRAVIPYDLKRSRVYKKVADGEMPKDSDPLSRDEIDAIGDWIRSGAKND
jgi:hypothetical protein